MIFRCLTLCVVLLFCPLLVWAQNETDLLQEIESKARNVSTLDTQFTQIKTMSMFKTSMKSSGRLVFASPDKLRWEYLEPFHAGFVIDGENCHRLGADQSKVSPLQTGCTDPILRALSKRLFAWMQLDMSALKKENTVSVLSSEPLAIVLYPLNSQTSGIASMTMQFTQPDMTVEHIVIHESEGDETRIDFHETTINAPLSKGLF
ncbi:LolA family protein [Desulfovibrio inopinatus]|uniref:LolA family protein n=1 Tax=Desulfovibrio inopinatus TaxID=102109 RepID=UPI000485068D|nr:outer membrane lipoprotein carrier protein LolA [Desulfovibrio inopinatus]